MTDAPPRTRWVTVCPTGHVTPERGVAARVGEDLVAVFLLADGSAFAIDLELRYRGLRAPHKIKLAVSGCARECAEAQSKDVGVIATERGWTTSQPSGDGWWMPASSRATRTARRCGR